jgi:hypothetical protein
MELPQWVPGPLRDLRRAIPAGVAIIVLIGAAVYLPSRSNDKDAAGNPITDAHSDVEGSANDGAVTPVTTSGPNGTTGTPGRGGATVTAPEELPGFKGSGGGQINRNSYQGVTDKDVKLVVSYQTQPCGQDPDAIIQQALPNADPEASISTALKWFSTPKRALANDLPPSILDKLGTGYYGRNVKTTIFDQDHGDFCPEQSRNDAKSVLNSNKPFGIIGGGNEWDEEATAQKMFKVTGRPATDTFFREHAPYLWGPITGASTINRFLAGYTKTHLAGKNSKATGDVRTASKKRVFGVIFSDTPELNRAKDEFLSQLSKRGVSVNKQAVVGYEPKLSTIAVQARNIIAQLIAQKVTTVLMLMDPIAVQFITQEADRQAPPYQPEWITNTYGLMDWSLGPRTFMSDAQANNTLGISAFWPSKQLRDTETEEYKAWNALHPNEDMPSDFTPWFASFKLFFRGLAVSGPELTPKNLEAGYHAFCNPCRRSASHMPLIGYGPGDYTAVDDAHVQHYSTSAPDYAAARCHHSTDDACDEWDGDTPPKGAYVYDESAKRFTSLG